MYAQRTSKRSKLNVRQLFGLADGKWFKGALNAPEQGGNGLAAVAVVLILVGEYLNFLSEGLMILMLMV